MVVSVKDKKLLEAFEAADQSVNAFDRLEAKINALKEFVLTKPKKE